MVEAVVFEHYMPEILLPTVWKANINKCENVKLRHFCTSKERNQSKKSLQISRNYFPTTHPIKGLCEDIKITGRTLQENLIQSHFKMVEEINR